VVDTLESTQAPPELVFETFEDWLVWAARQEESCEWVAGKVIWKQRDREGNFVGTTYAHSRLILFLARILAEWLEREGIEGQVLGPEFVMRTETRPSGREPDLLYVAPEHLTRIKDTYLEGPADLIVEVISEESIDRDRDDKFFEYQAAGVREYWLLDPQLRSAMFFRRGENGRYFRVELQEDVYASEVLTGFTLRISWLWQAASPRLSEVAAFWSAA
jgi:Uma2 family endonuclease